MTYYNDILGGQPPMVDLASVSPHPLAFCKATVSIRRLLFLFLIPIMELFERFVTTFPVRILQYVQGSCQRRKHGKQHERLCVGGVSERIYIVTMFGSHFRLSEVSKYVLVPFFLNQRFVHVFFPK